MSNLSKRRLLGMGLVAFTGLAGVGYVMNASSEAAGFEHMFMPVSEMKAGNALIVDIRTPQEWRDTGVIEGATLLTFRSPESFLAQIGPQLADGRDLILVCRSGNRTLAAAKALQGRIPNRIVSIAGGMRKVMASGYQPVAPR